MNNMTAEATGEAPDAEGGPMWGRFFDSIGGGDDGSESAFSGSLAHPELRSRNSIHSLSQVLQSPSSEVHPNDSASVVDDEGSVLDGYPRQRAAGVVPSVSGAEAAAQPDDGTYVFKFRTPSGRTHRFQSRHDSLEHLREIVSGKLAADPFFVDWAGDADGPHPDPAEFHLSYTDADGDAVLITADGDVSDAVKIARAAGEDRVVLFIQGGKGWSDVVKKAEVKAAEVAEAVKEEVKEVEKAEAVLPEGVSFSAPAHAHVVPPPEPELVMGIPKELLLPASIGALAVAIVAVFTISRMSSR